MNKVLLGLFLLLTTGCGMYQFTQPQGKNIFFQEITSSYELKRKMQTDWLFRQNYITFATHQSPRWYADYYSINSMWHSGISRWDFYWNRYDIWWNWGFNSHNWWGYEWWKPTYYYPNPSRVVAFMNTRRSSNTVTIRTKPNVLENILVKINNGRNETQVRNYNYSNPNINSNNSSINIQSNSTNIATPKFTPRINPNNSSGGRGVVNKAKR